MPSRWSARRKRFRAIMSGSACVHPGSVHDPISARIAEHVGFEVGMYAGSTASLTVLGAPDHIVLTLTEFADQALRISRSCELPVMVDADHGYGNALNVMRTVEELESAGIAGLSIEDTTLPMPHAAAKAPAMLSIEEGVGKMKAALAGRRDPDLVIAGRTSAPALSSVEDTIVRARAYEAAGVDAVFLVGIKSPEQLAAISAAIKLPIILGTAPATMMDLPYLASQRVRVCLQGHLPFQASIQAIYATLKALREGMRPAEIQGLPAPELVRTVTRADDYDRQMRDWLGGQG
jgi:oxaloacetate decarboxylase